MKYFLAVLMLVGLAMAQGRPTGIVAVAQGDTTSATKASTLTDCSKDGNLFYSPVGFVCIQTPTAVYNLTVPKIKPPDGLYIVKMQAGVMTFVSPYKSSFPLFVATGGMVAILMFLVGFHFRGKESK